MFSTSTGLRPLERNLQTCSQGLALRPFSAYITGRLRGELAERDLRHIPCLLAISPTGSFEGSFRKLFDFASVELRCVLRFSQPLDALIPSDASQASFSLVALVGFAPSEAFAHSLPTLLIQTSSPVASFKKTRLSIALMTGRLPFFQRATCPTSCAARLKTGHLLQHPLSRLPAPLDVGFSSAWSPSFEGSAACFTRLQGVELPMSTDCRYPIRGNAAVPLFLGFWPSYFVLKEIGRAHV